MRPPLRNVLPSFRWLIVAILLAYPSARAQRYDSMSAVEVQRRLERDTDALVNELRSRRNTPLNTPSFDISNSTWAQELRAREERKKAARDAWLEQRRLDAQWRRDHPGESRAEYSERMARERGAREAVRLQQLANRSAAQVAEFIALQNARLEEVQWAEVRRATGGFASRERPPVFKRGQEAVDWLVAHDREQPNQWAAVQAAILLIEGVDSVRRDPAAAARLVDPRLQHPRPDDDPIRAESLALHAYLSAAHPELYASSETPPDPAQARRDLEKFAETSAMAAWLLARHLAESADPADQARALVHLGAGYEWASANYEHFFGYETPSAKNAKAHFERTLIATLQRHQVHVALSLQSWSPGTFQAVARLLAFTKPAPVDLLVRYTDAIAERIGAGTLGDWFDYYSYGELIAAAGRAGSGSAHALATLDRFRLLETGTSTEMSPPAFRPLADMSLAVPALTHWAAREDPLGARARLALVELAQPAARNSDYLLPDLPEGQELAKARTAFTAAENADYAAWQKNKNFVRPSPATEAAKARLAAEQAAALAAFERREGTAPSVGAIPRLLAAIEAAAGSRHDLAALGPSLTGATPPPLAIDDPSFDLAKAADMLDTAFSPGIPAGPVRDRYLYAAARLGDAYAPYALSIQPTYPGEPAARLALQKISGERRARDEAAGLPRALLAKAIDALLRAQDATELLAAAARAGSPLAAALQLDQRIGRDMARETDRPPSWNLEPSLIAELDAAVTALHAEPNTFTDWSLVHALASPSEVQNAAQRWFGYVAIWDLDRQERIAEHALANAIQPQIDAVLATLAAWPGINQVDPLHEEWTAAAERDFAQAQEAIRNDDGLTALRLFLAAAGRGDRGALELLGRHIRSGDGGLPRSDVIADQIQAAVFRMTMTDAEIGDPYAANHIGEGYRTGRHGAAADPAQATEWLRYAASIGSVDAARTLASPDTVGLIRSPFERFQYEAISDALEQGNHLLQPPRRLLGARIDTAPVHAELEAAIAKFATFRNKRPVELSDAAAEKQFARLDAAHDELKKNPLKGLVLVAKVAAEHNRYAAQDLVRVLATGEYGLQPAPELARRFHRVILNDLARTAEYGNEADAHRVACHALAGLDGPPDTATGLRWLTYAAERGNYMSALLLARLHTETILPGIAPNPIEAARWQIMSDAIAEETFTPCRPLKR